MLKENFNIVNEENVNALPCNHQCIVDWFISDLSYPTCRDTIL